MFTLSLLSVLALTPPIIPDDVVRALDEGRVLDATDASAAWLIRSPNDGDATALLVALADEVGDVTNAQRAYAAVQAMANKPVPPDALPEIPPPARGDVVEDGPWYVAASRLRARERPDPKSKVRFPLFLGDEVRMYDGFESEDPANDWVSVVRVAPPHDGYPAPPITAFVQLRYLERARTPFEKLVERARSSEGTARVLWWERAAESRPLDVDVRKELMRVALAHRHFAIAARAAAEIAELRGLSSTRDPQLVGPTISTWKHAICAPTNGGCCAIELRPRFTARWRAPPPGEGRCLTDELRGEYTTLPHHEAVRQIALACPSDVAAARSRVLSSSIGKKLAKAYEAEHAPHLPLAPIEATPLGTLDVDGDGRADELALVQILGSHPDEESMWFSGRAPQCRRVVVLRQKGEPLVVGPITCGGGDEVRQTLIGAAKRRGSPIPALVLTAGDTGANWTEVWAFDGKQMGLVFTGCGGNG